MQIPELGLFAPPLAANYQDSLATCQKLKPFMPHFTLKI
jgi:hypothetical protein